MRELITFNTRTRIPDAAAMRPGFDMVGYLADRAREYAAQRLGPGTERAELTLVSVSVSDDLSPRYAGATQVADARWSLTWPETSGDR